MHENREGTEALGRDALRVDDDGTERKNSSVTDGLDCIACGCQVFAFVKTIHRADAVDVERWECVDCGAVAEQEIDSDDLDRVDPHGELLAEMIDQLDALIEDGDER